MYTFHIHYIYLYICNMNIHTKVSYNVTYTPVSKKTINYLHTCATLVEVQTFSTIFLKL